MPLSGKQNVFQCMTITGYVTLDAIIHDNDSLEYNGGVIHLLHWQIVQKLIVFFHFGFLKINNLISFFISCLFTYGRYTMNMGDIQ